MEVDASNFPRHLLRLLDNISRAEFVAFDLELTGIPSHLPKKGPVKTGHAKKTLQDRYAETREAANRYQILQIGITCGVFDVLIGKYVLRPYNITLSPLLNERLDIEREICIQSGAATFLLNNGFDLGAPFAKGVQYLSREEASQAEQMAFDRIEKKNVVEDVQLKPEDTDSIDFVRRVREAITKWVASPEADYTLHITSHTGFPSPPEVRTISRFEKRLVHQLVRAEFTNLVSMGNKDESIRIIRFDAAREEDNTKRMKKRTREAIARQTGFRWVFEALAHGDISDTDPFYSRIIVDGRVDMKDRWDSMNDRLRHHQPVIVGHNMFTDLVYLYRSFVGELPESLEDFCKALHEIFPRIIDTKWLATFAEGDLNASPSLQEIAESIQEQPLPAIATHHEHSQYHDTTAYHEAGFDSLLTATIMLQISAKLHHERQLKAPTEADSDDSFKSALETQNPFVLDGQEKVTEPIPIPPLSDPHGDSMTKKAKKKKKKNKKKAEEKSQKPSTRFQTKNLFDNLQQLDLDPEVELEPDAPSPDEPDHAGCTPKEEMKKLVRKPMELIPEFDSPFWTEFGNTLRIFGTEEAVLKIAQWENPAL
ncbi:CAF1-domain-containing protein [Periconia macrospinosa]|uniref:CAF1-domain-containing protein n=1 Tax=Periconia macrospinosa TaxID=97972 RepID=A0A2V1E1H8_9PLEO|nr:CAF1-domain-containing protein [Periconia macrospinosa]